MNSTIVGNGSVFCCLVCTKLCASAINPDRCVGNLLQLDTAMSTATNAYNIILARSSTGGTAATQFKVDGTGKLTAAGGGVFAGSGMAVHFAVSASTATL